MRAIPLGVLLVASLLSGTKDDETFKLDLLPKPEKGYEEKITFDAKRTTPSGAETHTKSVKGVLMRKIKALDEDGLSEKEQLTLEKASFEESTQGPNGGSSMQSDLFQTWSENVKRSGKARRARLAALPEDYYAEVECVLTDDPDALVRAILPEGPVEKSAEWEVDPEKLLRLFGPSKARASDKSKATATLDSVKKGVALVTVKATLRYTTPDDEEEKRLSLEVEVRGKIDGSAPPKKTKIVVTQKVRDKTAKKDVKDTLTVVLEREGGADEDAEKDEKGKKDKEDE